MLGILALLIFLLALLSFWEAGRRRKGSGLPGGRRIYSDTSHWQVQEQPLYDPKLGLSGRPDYIIEAKELIIPVEVKSSRPPSTPYHSHIYQLASYCLLIQHVYGVRPPYGVLHYVDRSGASRTFAIDYTPELEIGVTRLLAEMRTQAKSQEINRSHQSEARCRACGFNSICEQRLE